MTLALAACASSPPPDAVEAAPAMVETAPDAERAPPPTPQPVNDTSLTLEVYRAAGVPAIDRAWTPADYERALKVFLELLRSGRQDLPRFGSSRSGALFAHLVDSNNFEAAAASPGERARGLQRNLEVFPELLRLYSPASDGLDFSVEQAELGVCLLELLALALASSRAVASEDSGWSDEYEQQRSVTAGVLRGVSAMLGERERYSLTLRTRLRGELARLAPELAPHLESDDARSLEEATSAALH